MIPQRRPLVQIIGAYLIGLIGVAFTSFGVLVGVFVKGPRRLFTIRRRTNRPEVLDNPDLGTHHFARLKSVTLHYVEKGSPDKPLMIFLHGFPESWYSWRYQLKHFSASYRAVAIDMRGYGESSKIKGVSNYFLDTLATDVKNLVEALGYESCVLVGHDWGGSVAWRTAQLYPRHINRLVVCNCPNLGAMQKALSTSFSQLRKSWYVFFFQYPCLPEILLGLDDLAMFSTTNQKHFTDADVEAMKYCFKNYEDRQCGINYYRAMMRYVASNPTQKVEMPTLMVWGTGDAYLGKELAKLSGDYVAGPYTLNYLEGVSHWVQQEAPDEVNKCIDEFLSTSK